VFDDDRHRPLCKGSWAQAASRLWGAEDRSGRGQRAAGAHRPL